MTVEELQRAAASMTFCGGLSLWRPLVRIVLSEAGTTVGVEVWFRVPNRDQPTAWHPADFVELCCPTEYTLEQLRANQFPAETLLLGRVLIAMDHEMRESTMFGGVRRFDPHPPEPPQEQISIQDAIQRMIEMEGVRDKLARLNERQTLVIVDELGPWPTP